MCVLCVGKKNSPEPHHYFFVLLVSVTYINAAVLTFSSLHASSHSQIPGYNNVGGMVLILDGNSVIGAHVGSNLSFWYIQSI